MKIWLLKAREDLPKNGDPRQNPWSQLYDRAHGFVIAAETAVEARRIAQDAGSDETHEGRSGPNAPYAWLDCSHSTCEELIEPAACGVILRDYVAG